MVKATQRGFTLIELVVVIVILGILAAFAVPRFVNLQGQARLSAIQGLEGSVRSSAALAHALWLASGSPTTPIQMEGSSVTMVNGYPDIDGIVKAIDMSNSFTYAAGVFSMTGAPSGCTVTYVPAPANGTPTIAPPAKGACD